MAGDDGENEEDGPDKDLLRDFEGVEKLTPRERECLFLVNQHLSSQEIGRRLGLSKYTVDDHLAEASRRLGVATRRAAAEKLLAYSALPFSKTPILSTIREISDNDIPPQKETAFCFDTSTDGPIDLKPDKQLYIDNDQIELYEELKRKAQYLHNICPEKSNRIAHIHDVISSLIAALGQELAELRPRRLWSNANTLRRLNDADARSRVSDDAETPPLPEIFAANLEDVVATFNVFASGDPLLTKLDHQAIGPKDRATTIAQLEAGVKLLEAASREGNIFSSDAQALLIESTGQASELLDADDLMARQSLTQSINTQQNAALSVVRKAIMAIKKFSIETMSKIGEGIYKEGGSKIAKEFIFPHFVSAYRNLLEPLLVEIGKGDLIRHAVDLISKLFG